MMAFGMTTVSYINLNEHNFVTARLSAAQHYYHIQHL